MMEDTINYILDLVFQEEEGKRFQLKEGLIQILIKVSGNQGGCVLAI